MAGVGRNAIERFLINGWKRQLRRGLDPAYIVTGIQHWIDLCDEDEIPVG